MRIIAFGIGKRFQMMMERKFFDKFELIALIDNSPSMQGRKIEYRGVQYLVQPPSRIAGCSYDGILLTVESYSIKKAMRDQLDETGIPLDKIWIPRDKRVVSWPDLEPDEFLHLPDRKRLYVDVSLITEMDAGTGIQRVVNNLYKNMRGWQDTNVVPFQWFGQMITSREYESRFGCRHDFDGKEYRLEFAPDDKVLFLDSSFGEVGSSILDCIKQSGPESYAILNDLVPIRMPCVSVERLRREFESWIISLLGNVDNLLCISRSVADDVLSYCREQRIQREKPLYIFFFHLGYDIPASLDFGTVRDELRAFVSNGCVFLTVGTIEPRKNHQLALDVLKSIWQSHPEHDVKYLMLGRDGWLNDDVKNILRDEVVSSRTLWISDATDAEVQWAYKHSSALLYPSLMEGYGLPLIEAASFGLPVICSDIPIFHEVLGDYGKFFKVNDKADCKRAICEWLSYGTRPDSEIVPFYTWKDSAGEVLRIISGKTKPYHVFQ